MASFGVLIDPACTINGVDLKADLRGINIPLGTAGKDDTASGNASQLSKPGLKTAKMTLTFRQNFAAGAVNATIYRLWKNRTTLRRVGAAVGRIRGLVRRTPTSAARSLSAATTRSPRRSGMRTTATSS
jgi:hypothetical protein